MTYVFQTDIISKAAFQVVSGSQSELLLCLFIASYEDAHVDTAPAWQIGAEFIVIYLLHFVLLLLCIFPTLFALQSYAATANQKLNVCMSFVLILPLLVAFSFNC